MRIRLVHLEPSFAHDVEGIGALALPYDDLPPADGAKLDPSRQVVQRVFRDILKNRECVNHLCRLDAPRLLEAEPNGPPGDADLARAETREARGPAKEGTADEQREEEQHDAGGGSPPP